MHYIGYISLMLSLLISCFMSCPGFPTHGLKPRWFRPGLPRQEYWSVCHFLLAVDLSAPEIGNA